MSKHLDQPLRIVELSRLAGLSSSHYFAIFKEVTGSTPMDFFNRLRIQRAQRLLAAGSLMVKEVAFLVGYHDAFYFSRAFKSVNGVSPSEYQGTAIEKSKAR